MHANNQLSQRELVPKERFNRCLTGWSWFFSLFNQQRRNDSDPMDDQLLIRKIRRGSTHHFQLLFDRHWSRLYHIANNALDDPEDAADVVQEMFIDLWKRRAALDVSNPAAYLYQCVRFGIARKLKKNISRRTEEIFDDIVTYGDLTSDLEYRDLVSYVEGKIDELPDKCREVFRLSRFAQLSNKEIAEKLGISVSTVENQINKALKTLKADERLSNEMDGILMWLLGCAAGSQVLWLG